MSNQYASIPNFAQVPMFGSTTAAPAGGTPFTFTHPTPDVYPPGNLPAGFFHDLQRALAQILPLVIEPVVAGIREATVRETVAAVEKDLSGAIRTIQTNVNRLTKAVERLDASKIQAPNRTLDSILPKITIRLQKDDSKKLENMSPKQILGILNGIEGAPYKAIRVVRLRLAKCELVLKTDSLPAYRELIKPDQIATMTKKLHLEDPKSSLKHDVFWVVLQEYEFPQDYLRNAKHHLEHWKTKTKLELTHVKYEHSRLLWGFNKASEAIKACSKPIFFDADYAIAMAFDVRANPVYCRVCALPGHNSYDACCEHFGNSDHPWVCLICGLEDGHPNQPKTDTHVCPLRSQKQLWNCINCRREGIPNGYHRTDWRNCPSIVATKHRENCRVFTNALPMWAVHVKFPTTEQLKQMIEENEDYRLSKRAKKQGTNTGSQGNGVDGAGLATTSTKSGIVNWEDMNKKNKGETAMTNTGDSVPSNSNGHDGSTAESAIPVLSQGAIQQTRGDTGQLDFGTSVPITGPSTRSMKQTRIGWGKSSAKSGLTAEAPIFTPQLETVTKNSSIHDSGWIFRPSQTLFINTDSSLLAPRSMNLTKKPKTGPHDGDRPIPGLYPFNNFDPAYASPPRLRRKVPQSGFPTSAASPGRTQMAEYLRPILLPKGSAMKPIGTREQTLEHAPPAQTGRSGVAEAGSSKVVGKGGEEGSSAQSHGDAGDDDGSVSSEDMAISDEEDDEEGDDEEDDDEEDDDEEDDDEEDDDEEDDDDEEESHGKSKDQEDSDAGDAADSVLGDGNEDLYGLSDNETAHSGND